jgi:subfamily B ATP-binding cassette protein MsbA
MTNKEFNNWTLFSKFLRPYFKVILLIVAINVLMGFLYTARPLIIAPALDVLASTDVPPARFFSELTLNNLGPTILSITGLHESGILYLGMIVATLYVGISVGVAILAIVSHVLLVRTRTNVGRDLTVNLHTHLLTFPLSYFHKQRAGDLVSRLTYDVSAASNQLDRVSHGILRSIAQILLSAAILFRTDALFTLVIFLIGSLHFAITQSLGKVVRQRGREMVERTGWMSANLLESFMGIRIIKSYAAERYDRKRITTVADDHRAHMRRYRITTFYQVPARMAADALVIGTVLVLVFYAVNTGRLTLPAAALFFYLAQQLSAPFSELFTQVLSIQDLRGCADRIITTLNKQPAMQDGDVIPEPFEQQIILEGVGFEYEKNMRVLDGIDLTIKRGEMVALVGPSGAGKSTLVDLILRFYDPTEGIVRYDGTDIRCFQQRQYRRHFGVVSQESLLFNESVKENIVFNRPYNIDELNRAIQIANAKEFVQALTDKEDTMVGDRGVRLSGGQKQRIALARAIYGRPEILVLDEATSALDSESERAVQQAVDNIAQEMTVIAIAHRLSTIAHANKIVVLNKGRIEAIGDHQAVLSSSETYQRLYEYQFETSNN